MLSLRFFTGAGAGAGPEVEAFGGSGATAAMFGFAFLVAGELAASAPGAVLAVSSKY